MSRRPRRLRLGGALTTEDDIRFRCRINFVQRAELHANEETIGRLRRSVLPARRLCALMCPNHPAGAFLDWNEVERDRKCRLSGAIRAWVEACGFWRPGDIDETGWLPWIAQVALNTVCWWHLSSPEKLEFLLDGITYVKPFVEPPRALALAGDHYCPELERPEDLRARHRTADGGGKHLGDHIDEVHAAFKEAGWVHPPQEGG